MLKERWLHEGSRKKVLLENIKERGLNSILDLEVRCCSGVLKWGKARKAAGFRLLFFVRLPPVRLRTQGSRCVTLDTRAQALSCETENKYWLRLILSLVDMGMFPSVRSFNKY